MSSDDKNTVNLQQIESDLNQLVAASVQEETQLIEKIIDDLVE